MIKEAGSLGAVWLCAVGLILAAPAEAGIYKCTDAQGNVTFTGDPSGCASATPHRLQKPIQRATSPASARAASRAAKAAGDGTAEGGSDGAADDATDGQREMWQRKKSDAQAELQQVETHIGQLELMVKSCNRGGNWFRKDEAGMRKHVPCDEVAGELATAKKRHEELQAYLSGGLEDECRRAGCLPGWIR